MKTNIKDLPEDKLLELLCTRVNNWYIAQVHGEDGWDDAWYCEQGNLKGIVKVKDYNPLADSIQGKGQALELVLSLDMWLSSDGEEKIASCNPHINEAIQSDENLQRAIVLAAVASVCGEEVEL